MPRSGVLHRVPAVVVRVEQGWFWVRPHKAWPTAWALEASALRLGYDGPPDAALGDEGEAYYEASPTRGAWKWRRTTTPGLAGGPKEETQG